MSHPTWVRGLKLNRVKVRSARTFVAPYVGAWIETFVCLYHPLNWEVAPYVGAWIETTQPYGDISAGLSHPTWVRGLKLLDETNL